MSNGSPPTELAWDTPISQLISTIYDLSADLLANPPRLLVQLDQVQVDWQKSGLADPAASSLIDITLSVRPVAPATIHIHQPPAPVLSALNPNTAPAGADLTLELTGTGFDPGATVNVGAAYGLVPSSVSATTLSVVVKALNIVLAGTLGVSVLNSDRQQSNELPLTLT
jgi:IPT/TIG domain